MALSFNGKEVNTINFNNNVGYIVAGNPTINDGVASEFSADNYVRTVKIFPTSNISTLEWGCKFTTGSNVNYQGITGTGSYWGCYGFRLDDYGALVITLSFSPNIIISFPASTIKSNSTYISKAYWNATTKEFSAKVSGDNGKTWTTSSMVVSDDFSYRDVPVQFGKTQAGNFRGSIDFNETYIKVNGVTWFSGKEQASKDVNYVIKDGKLVWTNPNLWLESSGTQYIDTGYTPIQYDEIKTDIMFTSSDFSIVRTIFSAGTGNYQFTFGPFETKTYFKYFAQGRASEINFLPNINTWYSLNIDENGVCSFGGYTTTSTYTSALDGDNTTMYLFMRRNNTSPFIGKLKSFIIKNKGIIKKHFVPVPKGLVIGNYTVPSNGMWDIVSQTFFANQGTGNFTFGKDGTTPIWTRSV